uniref:O-methyltransferase domain-containing protein n=1 Tax=Oryza barthii TaxID=65489 RepID=A0A0D3GFA7_9ORYZ
MSCHAEQELSTPDMLQGHIELHHHLFGYLKSMALRCAADLGVPSAIHRRGGAATISDIAADTGVHPAKLPHLRRIIDELLNYLLITWYVLPCWGEEDCIKILQQCKKAIPARGDGGKVIIINAVVGSGEPQDNALKETQVLFDVYMMGIGGGEREEHEWKKIFFEVGFSDYKIKPILGFISVIEVYP